MSRRRTWAFFWLVPHGECKKMLVVAPRAEFGSLTPAVQRLEGILLGLVASVIVVVLWLRFPLADSAALRPAPAFPGELEV